METLFRWSKFVDEEHLEEWEARLIMAEVVYTVEKQVTARTGRSRATRQPVSMPTNFERSLAGV